MTYKTKRSQSLWHGAVKGFQAVLTAAVLCAFLAPHARARQSIPGANRPDAQIIVLPMPGGEWAVSTVYATKVARGEAEARLRRLLAATGWKAHDEEWQERALERSIDTSKSEPEARPLTPAPGVMSSLTFMTNSPAVDIADGTMDVAPFALAFRDLSRVHLTYLIPANIPFRFRGLRHFAGPDLDVTLSPGQGAYTYLLNIMNHKLENVRLPHYQEATDVPASAAEQAKTASIRQRARAVGTALVVLLAVGAGALVYAWATRLGAGRS